MTDTDLLHDDSSHIHSLKPTQETCKSYSGTLNSFKEILENVFHTGYLLEVF